MHDRPAPDAVGQRREADDAEDRHERGQGERVEHGRPGEAGLHRVGDEEGRDGALRDEGAEADADGQQEVARVVAQHLEQRRPWRASPPRRPRRRRASRRRGPRTNRPTASSTMLSRNGIRQPQARNSCLAGQGRGGGQHEGREHDAAGRAGVGEAGPQAAPRRRVLGGHQHRAAPLAADGDALHDAQEHQQDRCPHADLGVGGQQADQGAADAHQGHAQHEHLLAADPVAEVAEHDAAERAGEVAGGERAEAGDGADQRVEVGEEDLVEHDRGGRGVQQEVVVLDHAAEVARQHGTAQLRAREVGVRHRGALSAGGRPERRGEVQEPEASTTMLRSLIRLVKYQVSR